MPMVSPITNATKVGSWRSEPQSMIRAVLPSCHGGGRGVTAGDQTPIFVPLTLVIEKGNYENHLNITKLKSNKQSIVITNHQKLFEHSILTQKSLARALDNKNKGDTRINLNR